jgi:hypothetical protein
MTESSQGELVEQLKKREQHERWYYHLWRGMLSGVGAVLGIALLVYLLLPFLEKAPVIGPLIMRLAMPIEETAEQRLPQAVRPTPPPPAPTLTPPATATISGRTTITTSYYSLELPAGWDLKLNEGAKGVQLSRLEAESDDFALHSDETAEGPFTPIYYDAGASLVIHVTQPVGADSDHGQILETKTIDLDGESATWHRYREPSTQTGVLLDVHIEHAGAAYLISFSAAENFPNPAAAFESILDSLQFVA